MFCSVIRSLRTLLKIVQQHYWKWRLCRWQSLVEGFRISAGQCLRIQVPVRTAEAQGSLSFGDNVVLGCPTSIRYGNGALLLQPRTPESRIEIGNHCWFSNNVSIIAMTAVTIGDDFLCGDRVTIVDADFHGQEIETRFSGPGATAPIRIGNMVWLGSQVTILKGVTIGDNVIIAAGSVVTRNIKSGWIAGGNPARPLRRINP